MIGLDSNVLVRFLVQDDKEQAQRATKALGELSPEAPGFIPTTVLVETFWVLTRAYKLPQADVVNTLKDLVNSDSIVMQDARHVARAFTLTAKGADFPDALIAAACQAKGCTSIISFDHGAAKALGFKSP